MREGEKIFRIVQLVVCLGVLFVSLGLKQWGGPVYTQVKTWYNQQVNANILPDDTIQNVERQFLEILPPFSKP